MLLQILRFISIFASGVLAGGLYVPAIGVFPTMRKLDTSADIRFHQLFDARMDRFFSPLPLTALLSGLLLLFFDHDFHRLASFLTLGGTLGVAGMIFITLKFEFPLNRRVRTMPTSQAPEGYAVERRLWHRHHNARTVSGIASFAMFVLAALCSSAR